MEEKRIVIMAKATYRGVIIMESGEKFICFLGTDRHEFDTLKEITGFIDTWHALKKN